MGLFTQDVLAIPGLLTLIWCWEYFWVDNLSGKDTINWQTKYTCGSLGAKDSMKMAIDLKRNNIDTCSEQSCRYCVLHCRAVVKIKSELSHCHAQRYAFDE